MKFPKSAPRYQAGKIELEGGTGPITKMCSASGFLEIYKKDRTFRVYTPETLDWKETNPNMSWMTTCVANEGSGNKIIARVFIQAHEAINDKRFKKHIDKEKVLVLFHKAKELLLSSERSYRDIKKSMGEWEDKLRKGEIKKKGNVIIPFPVVEKLDQHVGSFLSGAKNFIQTHAEIFNEFFQTTFNGPRFDIVEKWCKRTFPEQEQFIRFLADVNGTLKRIVDVRNAHEHPNKGNHLGVNNFVLSPDNQIMTPRWAMSGEEGSDIAKDMDAILSFLVEFSEVFMMFCVSINLDTEIPYGVVQIGEEQMDEACPVRYRFEIDFNRIHGKMKGNVEQ